MRGEKEFAVKIQDGLRAMFSMALMIAAPPGLSSCYRGMFQGGAGYYLPPPINVPMGSYARTRGYYNPGVYSAQPTYIQPPMYGQGQYTYPPAGMYGQPQPGYYGQQPYGAAGYAQPGYGGGQAITSGPTLYIENGTGRFVTRGQCDTGLGCQVVIPGAPGPMLAPAVGANPGINSVQGVYVNPYGQAVPGFIPRQ